MSYGLLGGSFDPIHNGHLALARSAIEALGFSDVLLMPAARSPHKVKTYASAADRLAMAKLAIEDEPRFAVSDLEITRGGLSYTIDTLFELQAVRPGEYWLIIGSDALRALPQWKQPERLLKFCRLAVAERPGDPGSAALRAMPSWVTDRIDTFELKGIEVSSTELRNRIASGKPVREMLPPNVLRYITEHKLYRA